MKGQNWCGKVVLPKPHHHKIAGVFSLAQDQGVCNTHMKFYVNAASWSYATEWPLLVMVGRIRAMTLPICNILQHHIPLISPSTSSNLFNYNRRPYLFTLWEQFSCLLPSTNFQCINLQPYLRSPPVLAG